MRLKMISEYMKQVIKLNVYKSKHISRIGYMPGLVCTGYVNLNNLLRGR